MPHVSADLLMEVVQRSVWRETAVAPPPNDWGETMENGLMMAGLIHGSHRGICHKKGAQTAGVSAADQWIDLVQQGSVHDLTDPRSTSEWFPLPSSVENCVKAISISFIFPLSWRNFI